MEKPDTKTLTGKMKKWADFYLLTLNKTEAARRAGYAGSDTSLAQIGYENYRKLEIQAYMKERFGQMQMTAEEVMARLADMASGSHADFSEVNLREDLKDHPKAHLVKSIVADVHEDSMGRVHHKLRLELYDAQAALVHIGKQHGLFSDKHIVEMRLEKEIDSILDTLEGMLPPELYSNVLAAISGPEAGGETSTESQSAEVE